MIVDRKFLANRYMRSISTVEGWRKKALPMTPDKKYDLKKADQWFIEYSNGIMPVNADDYPFPYEESNLPDRP